jgi:glycosyltransferase involved in cell wall biosynthesis
MDARMISTNKTTGSASSKVLIFIVSFNAEATIVQVLSRIPDELFADRSLDVEVLIIDDSSTDNTIRECRSFMRGDQEIPLTVLVNPKNLGYGGNQKLGYRFAIDRGFDIVCLVHGDGQYAPEELPRLLGPLVEGEADAVFGSRMMTPGAALAGGMPLYKFFGNRVLSWLENRIIGTHLSEYHSGYRLYSTKALAALPFESNSNGFDFDTDIIIQLHSAGFSIQEIPIPTFYGSEISHVNGIQYAAKILLSCIQSRLQRLSLFYDRKFDVETENEQYHPKFEFPSSHQMSLQASSSTDSLLILGCGTADLVAPYLERCRRVEVVDQYVSPALSELLSTCIRADLNDFDFSDLPSGEAYDKVMLLDIVEHLASPEEFLERLHQADGLQRATLIITTPNVVFLPLRLMFGLGFFNYGKRGILDKTHTRLFTFSSLTRVLDQCGFEVEKIRGIPAPFPLALGRNSYLGKVLLRLNLLMARIWKGPFSYQIYCEARPVPTVSALLRATIEHTKTRMLGENARSEPRTS